MEKSESPEHRKLIKGMIDKYGTDGHEIVDADYEGYDQPDAIIRHAPDILAKQAGGLLRVCEAESGLDDFKSVHTLEQFEDFSNLAMTAGPLKGQAVPFDIVIPKSGYALLKQVLKENRILEKNIKIWTMDV